MKTSYVLHKKTNSLMSPDNSFCLGEAKEDTRFKPTSCVDKHCVVAMPMRISVYK